MSLPHGSLTKTNRRTGQAPYRGFDLFLINSGVNEPVAANTKFSTKHLLGTGERCCTTSDVLPGALVSP